MSTYIHDEIAKVFFTIYKHISLFVNFGYCLILHVKKMLY